MTTDDDRDTPLVMIWRESHTQDNLVPDALIKHRREVISRMASYAERTTMSQVSLPKAWHQYKHDNLISFFAVPGHGGGGHRWITERINQGPGLTVFWRSDDSTPPIRLEQLQQEIPRFPKSVIQDWEQAISDLQDHLSKRRGEVDAEVFLPRVQTGEQQDVSLAGWLRATSPDQRSFIDASTTRSIRLRGPAGSGKTLALTLKAAWEIVQARARGEEIRVLITTHSWALANQISGNIDMLGLGPLPELDIVPLLALAEEILPITADGPSHYSVVGEDSDSGKQAQLDEIRGVIEDFLATDWVTYRSGASKTILNGLESSDDGERLAFAWDLLTEFGSVIGAAGIFPSHGAEARYAQTPRSAWMMPIDGRQDFRIIFALYTAYMQSLEDRSLVTTDQVMADFLGHLTSHSWNRRRKSVGYDLVFVDEFHLFSPLERQVLHYLPSDAHNYPRIFMALDPRQSPAAKYIGAAADDVRSGEYGRDDDSLADSTDLELTTVHRFTPQVLDLVKHIHHGFPTYAFGDEWLVDFATIESSQKDGEVPIVRNASTEEAEEYDIIRAVHDVYGRGRMAIAIVDDRLSAPYRKLASALSANEKFHVRAITSREDVDGFGYRSKGIVIGSAENLAGLQFETVLVVGLPAIPENAASPERRRLLSLLYLAVTRAEREVRIFTNDSNGGIPVILERAIEEGTLRGEEGARV
ncbi:DEAD/DEAH box helicase family protein [Microbacterium sp. SSW1-49]|uniref:DEAD/DEAH box helicase family protein n=1 Tax=Microbacterium croceum TaxID=2851645 RepID=A0ABT0FC19_9MICO|nr:DEAD/DEAH box helicase family protein [Microbacterium croceum]MCK2035607.1 DEAD/DEAH box helicase family protein [Microbacterium croceum]